MLRALCFILCLFTSSGSARPGDAMLTFLAGKIGTGEIRMFLRRKGSEVSGTYHYTQRNKTIWIYGKIDETGALELREPRGVFNGRYVSATKFEGKWKAKKRELPFSLEEAAAPLTPTVEDVIEIPPAPLLEAYGEKRNDLKFSKLAFSPNGKRLAFALEGITLENPEQAWIFDLEGGKLLRLTEPTKLGELTLRIERMAWEADGRLTLILNRSDAKDSKRSGRQKVTAIGDEVTTKALDRRAERTEPYPPIPSPTKRMELRFVPPSRTVLFDTHKKRGIYRIDGVYLANAEWVSDDTFVHADGRIRGQGSFQLYSTVVDIKKNKFEIQLLFDDGWALTDAKADGRRGWVFFPLQEAMMRFSIVAFDVKSRMPTKQFFVGRYPRGIAVSADGAVAYTAHGCLPPPAEEESSVADGKTPLKPVTICVLKKT